MKYIEVILPLPLSGTFTYVVPDCFNQDLRPGMRVVVPFGNRKLYTAIIQMIHTFPPKNSGIKDIVAIQDDAPMLRYPQMKFWEWIASYYMAHLGEVYQAAVPAGLKLESETEIVVNPDFISDVVLAKREQQVLDMLSNGEPMKIHHLERKLNTGSLMPVIRKLIERGAVEINESLRQKVKHRTETCVRLVPAYQSEDVLRQLFDQIKKAPSQLSLLMHYIEMSKCLTKKAADVLTKKDLLDKSGAGASVLSALVARGVLELYHREVSRLREIKEHKKAEIILSKVQQIALQSILDQFLQKPVVLLHGVTSSGKTELYIKLIEKVMADKKQVLYLVPEIALTTQLTNRLAKVFGNKMGVYHSRFSDAERVEIWNKMLQDETYDIIIGVRSSVFLPFRQLGLVIVDEEHEQSYKQQDPAPRYHARNAAIMLAKMHGAKTLLGSATPSVESYFNALHGKYKLTELNDRHLDIELPQIKVVNMKEAYRKKQFSGHFSDDLLNEIKFALQRKEQIILFQNRRGYAPVVECKSCAYVPKCKHCDVSLTFHATFNSLNCHYCGYAERIPAKCPSCSHASLQNKGFGTEKVEDEVRQFFPEARVLRMDFDTTRTRKSYEKIISEVEAGKADILIGTQMVAKGLDFGNVSLVGILNADNMLNYPDFRAHERAFQMMAQVSGRAGRKHRRGLVVLQTFDPEHPVITQVLNHDYQSMFNLQSIERKHFHYPPFFRMIRLTLKHREVQVLQSAASSLTGELAKSLGKRVFGPVMPAISRIQNMFIRQIVIKIETEASHIATRELIEKSINKVLSQSEYKSVRIQADVDPF